MSKRKIITILVTIIAVFLVTWTLLSFYKSSKNTTGENTTGTNFLSEFFPFGKNKTNTTENNGTPTDISGYTTSEDGTLVEKLTKVSSMPVAGYGVFTKERYKEIEVPVNNTENIIENSSTEESSQIPTPPQTEFIPMIRYVERATGNIFQTYADKIEERKFTTTVIPQIYESYFGDEGNSVVMRYLKDDNKTIETYIGKLPEQILGGDTLNNGDISGSFLPENITDISVSPDALSVFYVFNSGNNAIGSIAKTSNNTRNQIFSSPFTEWLSFWPNDRMITITTKPSYNVTGYMYSIDPNTKKMTKILSDINGLTTLTSPSGKIILYSGNDLSLRIYNLDTRESTSTGIKTLPEKCTWSKTNTILYCSVPKYIDGIKYPDTWYMGEVSFSDEIWKINIENGTTTLLADPISFSKGEEIDGIKLSLDEKENYLLLINKKDSYLWELVLY
ncbi:MAG TPA: hypothetical protein PKZ36_01205 [Candidatus Paceibacterota bacterium]|nr:hypothetical protein [Candidatus Paceibacterota bacterium]HPT18007.1 hypothetical protein [Candidatus Paceibacterota bacterium]